ncbi:hypothetical protein AXK57_13905 [Tsukamurella pulmonis]|uniref:VOC family protein n=1 Tax=Tsukamurella pulmonis TaxID=47312 RepID=UPI0007979BB3|nr:VOC family protein [Tsukamurella pulmonis]KXP09912.1 hypothetical protein AXK57_13905 [Tsukamurella pulmonis]RDH13041.1 VOC family protein [Tsukamurella pulmonis]
MTTIRPFLMFQGGVAAAAIELYVKAFDGAVLRSVPHAGPQQGVQLAELVIKGQHVLISDCAVDHDFDFTPSTSLFVECDDRAELERLTEVLGAGGKTYMPLGEYGFSTAFAWVGDRFGVSWQLNLA